MGLNCLRFALSRIAASDGIKIALYVVAIVLPHLATVPFLWFMALLVRPSRKMFCLLLYVVLICKVVMACLSCFFVLLGFPSWVIASGLSVVCPSEMPVIEAMVREKIRRARAERREVFGWKRGYAEFSIGPDNVCDGETLLYDPTNGTLSGGDIPLLGH